MSTDIVTRKVQEGSLPEATVAACCVRNVMEDPVLRMVTRTPSRGSVWSRCRECQIAWEHSWDKEDGRWKMVES